MHCVEDHYLHKNWIPPGSPVYNIQLSQWSDSLLYRASCNFVYCLHSVNMLITCAGSVSQCLGTVRGDVFMTGRIYSRGGSRRGSLGSGGHTHW